MSTSFPGGIDTFPSSPSETDAITAIEKVVVGPIVANVKGFGAVGNGTTDDTTAFENALASLTSGGTLYIPPGKYLLTRTLVIRSRVKVMGAGRFATRLVASSTFAGPLLRLTKVSTADHNMFGQSVAQAVEDLSIEDIQSVDSSQTSGRSHATQGIEIVEADWVSLRRIVVKDLDGYGINMKDVVREAVLDDVRVWKCGSSTSSQAAVRIYADSGDESNTIVITNCGFVYNNYFTLQIDGDTGQGPRHIYISNSQIEGGGNGSGTSLGTPFPYDLVRIGRAKNVFISGCALGNPGQGKYCIRADGDPVGPTVQMLSVTNCSMGDMSGTSTGGGGLYLDRCSYASLDDNLFLTNPIGALNITASVPTFVWFGPGNVFAVPGTVITGTLTNLRYGATVNSTGDLRTTGALGAQHVGAATPTGGVSGDIKIGNGKIWVNDAGTWKSALIV